ncbi:MAG: YdeI/OmpD-associated family protein [Sumerlaeia bacterium]
MPKQFKFTGKVTRILFDDYGYTVIFVPEDVYAQAANGYGSARIRAVATIKGETFKCALQPSGANQHYILLSKKRLKQLGINLGEELNVLFTTEDPTTVDLPFELEEALNADARAKAEWEKLTPGKRRGLAYQIASAKLSSTRQKRVHDLIDSLYPLTGFFKELRDKQNKPK